MSRIDLVRAAVDEQLQDIYDLLALRLLFPPERETVKIGQEIQDLYVYPERLEAGLRHALAIRCRQPRALPGPPARAGHPPLYS